MKYRFIQIIPEDDYLCEQRLMKEVETENCDQVIDAFIDFLKGCGFNNETIQSLMSSK